jgi:putative ABC transport system ATP-binding protein
MSLLPTICWTKSCDAAQEISQAHGEELMSLLELKGVSKTYRAGSVEITALQNINLKIDKGEFIALSGPSGSGKSTLCNLIGLIDTPSDGKLLLNGQLCQTLNDRELSGHRLQSIGFIFQSFNLVPVFSALENVLLPIQLRGRVSAAAKEKASALLAALGLKAEKDRRPLDLSGGQQQRVAIARALITDPELIIADEPTANLDTVNAHAIIDIMHQRNRSTGTTFVFATHDDRLIARVDRQLRLRDGEIMTDTGSRATQ